MGNIDMENLPEKWFFDVARTVKSHIRDVVSESIDDDVELEAFMAVVSTALDIMASGADMAARCSLSDTGESFEEAVEREMVSLSKSASVKVAVLVKSLDSLGVTVDMPDDTEDVEFRDLPPDMQKLVAENVGEDLDEMLRRNPKLSVVAVDSRTGLQVDMDGMLAQGAKVSSVISVPMGMKDDDDNAVDSMLDMFGGSR